MATNNNHSTMYYMPPGGIESVAIEDRGNNKLDSRLDSAEDVLSEQSEKITDHESRLTDIEEMIQTGSIGGGSITEEQINAAVENVVSDRLNYLLERIETLEAALQANDTRDDTQAEQISAHDEALNIINTGLDEIIGE